MTNEYYPPKRRVSAAVLALDPGITTGWALLDRADGAILATSVWGTAELKQSLDIIIRQCFTSGLTLEVVQEEMPPGAFGTLARKLEAVRRDISGIVVDTYELPVTMVTPGEWKPSRVARTTKVPWKFADSPLLIHQKDAIRMGRYVIDKQKEAA